MDHSRVFIEKGELGAKPITLREARSLALQVFQDARRRLREERSREARFLLSQWEE